MMCVEAVRTYRGLVLRWIVFLCVLWARTAHGHYGEYNSSNLPQADGRQPSSVWINQVLLKGYEKRDPPSEYQDGAVSVRLGIFLNSFHALSEQSMDYSLNIYVREEWEDPRLAFIPYEPEKGVQVLKFGDYLWNRIWVPDVFFRNEKEAKFHYVTRPNRVLRLYSNGTVYYASKLTCTLACTMELHKYPLDTQKCPMMIESFGYTSDVLMYSWMANTVELEEKDFTMQQFVLLDYKLVDCSQNYSTGVYPCLEVDFYLKRSIGYYIIQIYIPSVLIVILSWVAFWISIDAIPARVTIGLLTVLTMTTQSAGARESLPRVSYIKALDVWMSVCLVFVFSSLLEFAVVNVFSRKDVRAYRLDRIRANARAMNTVPQAQLAGARRDRVYQKIPLIHPDDVLLAPTTHIQTQRGMDARQKAGLIDKLARKLFPLSFILFNVVYWVCYVLW